MVLYNNGCSTYSGPFSRGGGHEMGWFIKRKRQPGWLALGLYQDRIDLVHVRRGADGAPAIAFCDSFRIEGSEALTLKRLRQAQKLDRYRCTTLLSTSHYQLHQVDAPAVPLGEIKAAVRWRMKDIIDYPVESATIEVLHIPGDPAAPGREHGLYAVTARSVAIAACVRPFEDSQVALEAVDIPDLAQRNVAALFENDGGAAMLAVYETESLLTFTRHGELLLSRRIDVGLPQLRIDNAERRAQTIEHVVLEVQRSLDNFEYQFPDVAVSKLLLAPLPRDTGLAARLTSNLAIPVEAIDFASVMDLAAAPDLAHAEGQSQYLPLIGAALRGEEAAAA